MEDVIVNTIFGLSVFLTLPLAMIGILKHSCKLLGVASVLSLPFSLYAAAGYSLIFKLAIFVPLLFLLSCYFLKRDKRSIFWALMLIAVIIFLFIYMTLKFPVMQE